MKTPDVNAPLPLPGPKVQSPKPLTPPTRDPRSPTNPEVRIGPDGKMYTDIPANQRARFVFSDVEAYCKSDYEPRTYHAAP